MESFIYVFSKSDAETMLSAGYELLRADEANKQYIFANNPKKDYFTLNVKLCMSNTFVL